MDSLSRKTTDGTTVNWPMMEDVIELAVFYDRDARRKGSRCWPMLHTMKFTDSIDEHLV
jgi:hypothetical protein